MPRALAALLALALLAFVAAGCGSSGSSSSSGGSNSSGGSSSSGGNSSNSGAAVFTAKGTVPCLRQKGFTKITTTPAQLGLIAGNADNGGLRATAKSGNSVVIAFTQGADGVPGTERAFKRFAKGVYKRHIKDVMRAQGNAVLVWTTTPTQTELSATLACLHT
jgi:hypothetical protein